MKSLSCAAVIIGMTLSGCVSPPQPMSNSEILQTSIIVFKTDKCVQKGHFTELTAVAMYKNEAQQRLNLEPNQDVVNKIRKLFSEVPQNDELPSLENCRSLELDAVNYANLLAQAERQREQSKVAQYERRQPRYANCITTLGNTSCVTY
ncbi:hypothetical protein ACOI1H_06910 [Loktanella sp. DJP18]|uniref:hypothetical protein n=1 Tax=Loktanella sp. DJP18 TaxID=3409788 RepID=UPI003BB4C22E